jgi:hypothetical protein
MEGSFPIGRHENAAVDLDQRGQDRSVGPVQSRPWTGSPQHRHFVPQDSNW